MLDFYDEDQDLAQFCEKQFIILNADKLAPLQAEITEMDMREMFVIDSFHF